MMVSLLTRTTSVYLEENGVNSQRDSSFLRTMLWRYGRNPIYGPRVELHAPSTRDWKITVMGITIEEYLTCPLRGGDTWPAWRPLRQWHNSGHRVQPCQSHTAKCINYSSTLAISAYFHCKQLIKTTLLLTRIILAIVIAVCDPCTGFVERTASWMNMYI